MAAKVFMAITGCSKGEHQKIINLGGALLTNLYDEYDDKFTTPKITKTDFKAQYDILVAANAKAILTGAKLDITDRDNQSDIFYDMINDQMKPYINGLYKGNKTNLEKSGMPVSKEPAPHVALDALSVKKAVKGKETNTVKFYLNKLVWPKDQLPESLIFFVYVTTDPDKTDDLKLVCKTTSSRKLIAPNDKVGVYLYYYLTAQNSAGESPLSERVRFMQT